MQLKEIRQQGDCFYCGDYLVGVVNRVDKVTMLMSRHESIGYYFRVMEIEEFRQHWTGYGWCNRFVRKYGDGVVCSHEGRLHESMVTYTDEERNSYYVYNNEGCRIKQGLFNVIASDSSYFKVSKIEIEPWNEYNVHHKEAKGHYLFKDFYDSHWLFEQSCKVKEMIRQGEYYYMFNHEKIYKVCRNKHETYSSREGEHWYMMPQHYYPVYKDKILVKTMKEKCDELDNIYAMMDSFNDDSNALGKTLLKAYYKQHKGGK